MVISPAGSAWSRWAPPSRRRTPSLRGRGAGQDAVARHGGLIFLDVEVSEVPRRTRAMRLAYGWDPSQCAGSGLAPGRIGQWSSLVATQGRISMAKEQKKSGGKGKARGRKLGVKKQTVRDLEPLEGDVRRVKGGMRSSWIRKK